MLGTHCGQLTIPGKSNPTYFERSCVVCRQVFRQKKRRSAARASVSIHADHVLSNLVPCSITHEDWIYPTPEHAFQASKTVSNALRHALKSLSAKDVRRAGEHIIIRPGWRLMQTDLMRGLLTQKFSMPIFARHLLNTGDADLHEVIWQDPYWGHMNGQGKNMLGVMLMEIRGELLAKGE